jgi:hypothetical protein
MRSGLPSLVIMAALNCSLSSAAAVTSTQPLIDAYMNQVGEMVVRALTLELAKRREPVTGKTKFSFLIDPAGHASDIKAVSTPRNAFAEQTILRVIRHLRFPPIPERIVKEDGYKYLKFTNEMDPLDH